MFDAKRLLDQFLGSGDVGSQGPSPTAQPAPPDPSVSGGRSHGGHGAAPSGGLSPWAGVAGGALAGGLAGVLLGSKKTRKMTGKLATYGGLAAVAGLAYKAYRDWQANQPPSGQGGPQHGSGAQRIPEPPADGRFLPPPSQPQAETDLSLTLMRAMITAAKADGHIDADEYRRIFEHLNALNLDAEAKAFVMDELSKPMDVRALTEAATTPEIAAEIYTASLLAIDPDGPAEKGYLAMLAAQLRLDPALVEHLHGSVVESTA